MVKKVIIVLLLILFVILFINILYPTYYSDYVYEYSEYFGVDPNLIFAIIRTESKFDKNAKSPKGAKGLMQIMDPTAEELLNKLGISEDVSLYDPQVNILLGSFYISELIKKYEDVDKALAAYNSGMSNVKAWEDLPGDFYDNIDFEETRNYISKVNGAWEVYDLLLGSFSFIHINLPESFSQFRSNLLALYYGRSIKSI